MIGKFFGCPKKKIQFFKKKQLFFKKLFGKRFSLYFLFYSISVHGGQKAIKRI